MLVLAHTVQSSGGICGAEQARICASCNGPFCKLRKPFTGESNNEDVDPEAPARCRTVSFDASQETHYVIVVHGTFDAPPDDGSRTWYQPTAPGEINFCSKIDARLAEGPLGGGCVWRELPAEPPARLRIPYPFHWDGTNTHEGRIDAAHKLARLLDLITHSNPSARIHVIAHSHGGNVLLKAIELHGGAQGRAGEGAVRVRVLATGGRTPCQCQQGKNTHQSSLCSAPRFSPLFPLRQLPPTSSPPSRAARSMAGRREGSVKEQYPWGRYRWLDSLLRLPSQRQRLFLAHRLATSPLSNALGGVVFLGTPFYMKTWQRNGMLLLLATTAVSMVVTFVVMWGYVLLWRLVVLAIAGELSRTATPTYLPFSLAAAVLVFAIVSVALELFSCTALHTHTTHYTSLSPHPLSPSSVFFLARLNPSLLPFSLPPQLSPHPSLSPARRSHQLWRSTAFYSGNIYHSPGFDWSHAMSALVIHAGKLDEASLALSTEPIARAYIFPQLASMLKLPFWKALPRRPVTRKCSEWTLYISNTARILMWNIIFILPALAVALLSRVLAPVIISMVCNVIVTVSFGLSAKELSFASVFVDERLNLGLTSQLIEHWNVQKLLALAKTRSLQGELMEGYEDDTCDMGEVLFGDGLPEEGVPREGVPREGVPREGVPREGMPREVVTGVGLPVKGVTAEGLTGREGKVEEGKEQEEVGEREVRVRSQGEADERAGAAGAEGEGSAVIDSIQTGALRPEPLDSRAGPSGTLLGGEAGEEGGGRSETGSARRSLSRFRRRVTFTERSLRQGERRGEGGEELDEEGGVEGVDGKEKRAGKGVSSQGGGSSAWKAGAGGSSRTLSGGASVERANEESKGKQQQGMEEKGMGSMAGSGGRGERLAYKFLWDDGVLEAAARESETYKLLRPQLHAITHNPRLSDQECVRQVKQLCVMIEERFGELTGRFDLNHGAYFRDPRIIGAMVHFLGYRELPDWSREIDTDVLRAEERIRFGRLGQG
ncbi:unnamed protein product [Closterium sp. Naga37s-1]|nr:unnamed protein product [Closterium sp. Naga37s-1]